MKVRDTLALPQVFHTAKQSKCVLKSVERKIVHGNIGSGSLNNIILLQQKKRGVYF